jgi:two-component system OmpR family response regulator
MVFDQYPASIHWGSLDVMPSGLRVYQDGERVTLTLRQFEALMAFLANPHRTLSREDLWRFCLKQEGRTGESPDPQYRMVDVYVAQLRRRLGRDVIETVRGVGYQLGSSVGSPALDKSS